MKKLGILVIHGSGTDHRNKLEKFIQGIQKQILKMNIDANQIEFETVNWHPAVQVNQEKLWNNFKTKSVILKWKKIRQFVLYNMSDNFVYSGVTDQNNEVYQQIHDEIYKSVVSLKNKVSEDSPLIIISSSMGTTIASNYIWDRQKKYDENRYGKSPFEKLETLTGLIMMGSTIPMYAAAYSSQAYQCIVFPPENLSENLKKVAAWHVYYDPQDVLGFPLKPVNSQYEQLVSVEEALNIGGILTFWNPASHIRYLRSKKINKKISGYIEKVLKNIS
jgi:hypothetical protein